MSCLDGRNDPIVVLTLHKQYTKNITNIFHFGNLIVNRMKCIKFSNINIYMIARVENMHDQSFQSFVILVLGNI